MVHSQLAQLLPSATPTRHLHVTLLELISALCEETSDDREVTATALRMLKSHRVRLCGNFADETFE